MAVGWFCLPGWLVGGWLVLFAGSVVVGWFCLPVLLVGFVCQVVWWVLFARLVGMFHLVERMVCAVVA